MGSGSLSNVRNWEAFFNGNIQDHLQGLDWGIFMDKTMIEASTSARIQQGLLDNNKLQVVTGIGSNYSNSSGQAIINTQFSGNIDTPICTVWITITIISTLGVNQTNVLNIDTNISWDTGTSACTVTAAILGAAVGFLLDFIYPIASFIVDPILGALGAISTVAYLKGSVGPGFLPIPNCTAVSETHYNCIRRFTQINSVMGVMNFNSIAALGDGISMNGQLRTIPVGISKMSVRIDTELHWDSPEIDCGEISGREAEYFRANPHAYAKLSALVYIDSIGLAPVYLMENVQTIDDPLGVFSSGVSVQGTQAPIEITIKIAYPGDAYYANPYPCKLLIKTSAGTRLILLQSAPALTDEDIERIAIDMVSAIGECKKLVDRWFSEFLVYNPKWGVDPANKKEVEHWYEFEVFGLEAGREVSIATSLTKIIQTRVAQVGQPLKMNVVVVPSQINEISLFQSKIKSLQNIKKDKNMLEDSEPVLANGKKGISMKQKLIVHTATIQLLSACEGISAMYFNGIPCVFAQLKNNVCVFDLSNPYIPKVLFTFPMPNMLGMVPIAGSMVAFGESGFTIIGEQRQPNCGCGEQATIYKAVPVANVIYALSDRGLDVFNNKFSRLATIETEQSHALARLGDMLIVVNPAGLKLFNLAHPKQPVFEKFYFFEGIKELLPALNEQVRSLLAIPHDGSSKVLTFISNEDEPKVVATYPTLPWYVGSSQLKNIIVKLNTLQNTIQVSYYGNSKKM